MAAETGRSFLQTTHRPSGVIFFPSETSIPPRDGDE
jgi:hypothetical protein